MIRHSLLVALLALPGIPLVAVDASPGLDPTPHVQPLVPTVDDPATMTPADRLQRRLESLVRERDQRIRDLLLQRENIRPATGVPTDPTLAQPTREREQARLDLRRALEAYDERASSQRQDVLDATRPLAQAVQRSTLAATNQLRIAECYHDLAATGTPDPADLAAGLKALGLIEVADLGEGEPARMRYLQAWFLIEQARQATGEERSRLATSATTAVERLAQEHPTSELVTAARGLLAGLTLPGTVAP
jgi:Skp family chaperone for outer membrane proteins